MEQLLIGAVYIASRSLGKISGSYVSCKATRCSEKIQKYLGITLLPQAGVALEMCIRDRSRSLSTRSSRTLGFSLGRALRVAK